MTRGSRFSKTYKESRVDQWLDTIFDNNPAEPLRFEESLLGSSDAY